MTQGAPTSSTQYFCKLLYILLHISSYVIIDFNFNLKIIKYKYITTRINFQ